MRLWLQRRAAHVPGHARHRVRPARRRAGAAARGGWSRVGPQASTASSSWRPRWRNPREVAAGGAVAQRQLDLLDPEAGAGGVDRHPHLAAEPGREREARRPCRRRERALARERLRALEAASAPDQRAGAALGDAEAAALLLGERRDREVGAVLERAARGRRRGRRRRAAARPARPRARRASSACPLPRRGRRTTRAPAASASAAVRSREPSSATITSASGKARAQRVDRRPDPRLLVARRDRIVSGSATRRRRASASAATTPSPAESFTPYCPGGAPAEQQHEREASRPACPRRPRSRARPGRRPSIAESASVGPLDADRGRGRRGEAGVEAGEEARRRPASGAWRCGRRPRRRPGSCVPPARSSTRCVRRASVPERRCPRRARAPGRARGPRSSTSTPVASAGEPRVDPASALSSWRRSIGTFSARSRSGCAPASPERLLDQRCTTPGSTEPTKTTATCLPAQAVPHQRRIGLVDEGAARPAARARSRSTASRSGRAGSAGSRPAPRAASSSLLSTSPARRCRRRPGSR